MNISFEFYIYTKDFSQTVPCLHTMHKYSFFYIKKNLKCPQFIWVVILCSAPVSWSFHMHCTVYRLAVYWSRDTVLWNLTISLRKCSDAVQRVWWSGAHYRSLAGCAHSWLRRGAGQSSQDHRYIYASFFKILFSSEGAISFMLYILWDFPNIHNIEPFYP